MISTVVFQIVNSDEIQKTKFISTSKLTTNSAMGDWVRARYVQNSSWNSIGMLVMALYVPGLDSNQTLAFHTLASGSDLRPAGVFGTPSAWKSNSSPNSLPGTWRLCGSLFNGHVAWRQPVGIWRREA